MESKRALEGDWVKIQENCSAFIVCIAITGTIQKTFKKQQNDLIFFLKSFKSKAKLKKYNYRY